MTELEQMKTMFERQGYSIASFKDFEWISDDSRTHEYDIIMCSFSDKSKKNEGELLFWFDLEGKFAFVQYGDF